MAIAEKLGKHIFPVLIHSTAPIPAAMQAIQYADLSKGLDAEAVKHLLSAIHVAERERDIRRRVQPPQLPAEVVRAPSIDPITFIDQAAEALDLGEYDRAVFLLKQARDNGYESRFVDLQVVLQAAEAALEQQAYLREAEREYRPIAILMKRQSTFKLGCQAFRKFRKCFPDYDPEDLASIFVEDEVPAIEWRDIPAGEICMERNKKKIFYQLDAFRIGKFPITNQQFQMFIDAPDGYNCEASWGFSPDASSWHRDHPNPQRSSSEGPDCPRTNISWYEAMAFCEWLHIKTGIEVMLPTQQQWLRAAQGDQQFQYPWGNRFDKSRCNTLEGGQKKITPVDKYPGGASPFGVYDMAGNTWEWCGNKLLTATGNLSPGSEPNYAVYGGCYTAKYERSRSGFYCKLKPGYRYHSIGFRIACLTG